MSKYHVRVTFYGREEFVEFPCEEAEYQGLIEAAKRLATGSKANVGSHYLLTVSPDVKALLAIREIQAVYFMEGEPADRANGILNGTKLLDVTGVALNLKGRTSAITLKMPDKGPLGDMVEGLASSDYEDEGFQCVMLADAEGCSIFFVLDEVQYALISSSLLRQ